MLRPGLKNDKTPKQRIFFHCATLKIFEIHKVFLQMFASPDEKNLSPLCISPSIKQGLGGRPVTENSPALSFKNGYFNLSLIHI